MRKKRYIIFIIILLITTITINTFAVTLPGDANYGTNPGNSEDSEQETTEVQSKKGDVTTPGGIINYVSENQDITTKEELIEALNDYLDEDYLEEGVLKIEEKWKSDQESMRRIDEILNNVSEETIKKWADEDEKTFEDYRLMANEVNNKLGQNSQLKDNNKIQTTEEIEDQKEAEKKDDDSDTMIGTLGNSTASASHTPDEIIGEAENFLNQGTGITTINGQNLEDASSTLYNILLSIGIFLAVAIGMYLGIKFMLSNAEDKAKVKEALIPYIVGCVVIFSAFVIWKIAILLLRGIA